MKTIAVTGGSGRLGHAVVLDLVACGYQVVNIDMKYPPKAAPPWYFPFRECDMNDYGQTFAALHGCDAIVHLANDPRPDKDHFTGAQRFKNNTLATYNVFNAAVAQSAERIVWASSETIYGFPFDEVVPDYVPMDEHHPPYPQSSYALSKLMCEQLAQQFNRWSNIPFIGLQLSNIVYPEIYEQCPDFWADPTLRIWDLWSYIDYRDAVQSIRKSLIADITGAETFIVAADDTIMNRSGKSLIDEYFPDTKIRDNLGEYQSLINNQKAKELLGFQPEHSWRDYVTETGDVAS